MIKAIGWSVLGLAVIVGGFYWEYESLDPCEWMTQEMSQYASLGKVTGFGDTASTVLSTRECFENWMDLRVKGAESK